MEHKAMKRPALGRGLSALIPGGSPSERKGVIMLGIEQIQPDRGQPRRYFDELHILELSESKKELTFKRLVSECIHQIGMIRGLAHCPNNRCVMFFSATVQDTDKKGMSFCANCRKRLMSDY